MPERTAPEAALRFVRDLRSLREARGVSLETIRDATRVPVDVLGTFEASALHGNRLFNRVYLRSLVRAYAGAVDYDPDRAVFCLEEALAGQYDGALLRDDAPEETPAAPAAAPPADGQPAMPEGPAAPAAPPIRVDPERVAAPVAAAPPIAAEPPVAPVPPAAAWDAVSGSTRRPRAPRRDVPWGWIGGIAAALALLALALVWWNGRSRAPAPPVAAAPDSLAAPAPAPARAIALPDTLRLVVTGLNDGIQEMRLTVDEDVRRPYWIETGASRTFTFVERVIVENQLEDATLTVEGARIPATTDAQGRVVIDRARVRQLLEGQ